MKKREAPLPDPATNPAFLLSQVGAHASARFGERVAVLGLSAPHTGILFRLSASEGVSQRSLARALGVMPSRLVDLLDELEQRGLVERRNDPDDRRVYALHLTRRGRLALQSVVRISQEHQDALLAALSPVERATLASLLKRVADEQGLLPGVHPGYARIGRKRQRD
jgi:DNA-binding MarR family transcriptional regulator